MKHYTILIVSMIIMISGCRKEELTTAARANISGTWQIEAYTLNRTFTQESISENNDIRTFSFNEAKFKDGNLSQYDSSYNNFSGDSYSVEDETATNNGEFNFDESGILTATEFFQPTSKRAAELSDSVLTESNFFLNGVFEEQSKTSYIIELSGSKFIVDISRGKFQGTYQLNFNGNNSITLTGIRQTDQLINNTRVFSTSNSSIQLIR